MSDKLIMKAISNTYFIILSLLLFIFLTFTFIFILLQNGLHIEKISISNLQAKQLYIKWDEKIELSIKEVLLLKQKNSQYEEVDYKSISKFLKVLMDTAEWFESIIVESIKVDDFEIVFHYEESSKGFLEISSPSFELSSSVESIDEIIKMKILKMQSQTKKMSLYGDVYFDLNSHKFYTALDVSLNSDANLTFYSRLDTEKIEFNTESHNEIKNLKQLIKLLSLPKELQFWAHDAIALEKLELQSLKGEVNLTNIDEAFKNIYLKAKAHKLLYTYNNELDSIHSAYTDLEFKDGVLYIAPKNAYSYKQNLGKSWLKIDFTQKDELLTLHLLFDGILNEEMLKILKTYKIKLPFYQNKGLVNVDLSLAINLISIDVDAQGKFYIKSGNFDYMDLNLDVFNAKVLLDNHHVKVESMKAHYKEIAQANVKVDFNAKTSEGKIDFLFDSITLDELKLNAQKSQLFARYTISPIQDSIQVDKSLWDINGYLLSIDSLDVPFDLKKFKLILPTTFLELQGISSAFVSGEIDIKNATTQLLVDILSLSYSGVKFSQSDTPFHVSYSDKLSITSPENLFFTISGTEYLLEKPIILVDKEQVVLKNSKLKIGQHASTKIYAKHDLKKSNTHVSLSDLIITDAHQFETLFSKKKVLLSIKEHNKTIEVNSQELDTTFFSNEKGWALHINSLSQLVSDSEFLRKFNIDTGDFTLYKEQDQKNVWFYANIVYPHKILTQDGIPTENYNLEGEIKKEGVSIVVNEQTDIFIDKEVHIKTKETGINVNAIINAISEFQTDDDNDENLTLSLTAIDSYLYVTESRKVLAELINLQYTNEILTAQLSHEKGRAGLRLQDKKFHLYGKDFNDIFMHELFAPSKFKGGSLEFSINGVTDEYSGVFYINNSTVLEYRLLNNILAFINTVPSLVTFSLPGYSTNGLFIEEAYVNFQAKEKVFKLSDIYLDSKELNILGYGKADFNNDTLDVKLNLKTDLASDVSQIPLVGYILFDKESVSTTLNLKGDLKDPKVESLLAKDIAVAPINIIKRALTLPYDLLNNIVPETNSSN